LSLPRIIEQIDKLDAKVLNLRERSRHAADAGSREFFRMQAEHFWTLRSELEAMRVALENIEARAKEISSDEFRRAGADRSSRTDIESVKALPEQHGRDL
jgi:hypothetical protein